MENLEKAYQHVVAELYVAIEASTDEDADARTV